jgi:Flp pilus assembly CpaE family ATPase
VTAALIALPEPRASELAAGLERAGIDIVGIATPGALPTALLADADALILPATRAALSSDLIAACDRAGVRVVALGTAETRLLSRHGLPDALPEDSDAWQIADALSEDAPASAERAPLSQHRIIAVWGAHGSPGRSTVAIQLATEFSRTAQQCVLIDADTVAPSLALLLGLGDDAPGLAAACRRAEFGGLDAAELRRLASVVETASGGLNVFAGINRPSRWPEISAERVKTTLGVCRDWADVTVVDVAASFDSFEEVSDDLIGPRRHAATTAVLREADVIVAVTAGDPLSISRFLRDHAELRNLVGPAPRIAVVANKVRPGPLGVDARGQIRRSLERFAGITDVTFLPFDQRAADAALLHGRTMADLTPRAALVSAVRRLAARLDPAPDPALTRATADNSRESSRVARWLRRGREVPAASRPGSDPGWAS